MVRRRSTQQPEGTSRVDAYLRRIERVYNHYDNNGYTRNAEIIKHAAETYIHEKNAGYLRALMLCTRIPVSPEEFFTSEEFIGGIDAKIYSTVLDELKIIIPDIMLGNDPIHEVLLGGGIGTFKSFTASMCMLYTLYFLTCYDHPQELFNLTKYTKIVMNAITVRESVAKRVLYEPIRDMFLAMPYTQRWVEYDTKKENILSLANNVELIPSGAILNTYIGQAVIAAVIDEINYMQVIQDSKQIAGPSGQGGLYDQAQMIYDTLTNRRQSRFITNGPSPGGLYLCSSVNYKDDFLEKRIRQIDPERDTEVYVSKKKQYEAIPASHYCGDKFRFLVGTDRNPARILKDEEKEGEDYPESAQIEFIPIEYERQFRDDPESAQRDICGIASSAINRFMTQTHKAIESSLRFKELGYKEWVIKHNVSLGAEGLPSIIADNLPADLDTPRYVHIDLSKNKDRCAIAVSKIAGFEAKLDEDTGIVDNVPHVVVEMVVSIKPDKINEIDIAAIRNWVLQLHSYYGLNIKKVTYDQYQSTESQQAIRKMGISSGLLSIDLHPEYYQDLKDLTYQDRIEICGNDLYVEEVTRLERNERTGKIDHPPKGSKDVSDAVCGAVQNALSARMTKSNIMVTDSKGARVVNKTRSKRTRPAPVRR